MRILFFTVLFCILIFTSNSCLASSKGEKITFFYYGWDVLTRHSLSPGYVRENYKMKISFTKTSDAERLINRVLAENNWTNCYVELDDIDVRLVVDVSSEIEGKISLLADRFKIYQINNGGSKINLCTDINEEFKDNFESFLTNL